jgi:uncharacterized FlgJ-related protein
MTASELDQMIYDLAIANGFNQNTAKYVVAQARLESANYTSNVFKNNNNLNGMKYIGQANATKGTKSPEGDYYAKWKTPEDSAKDVVERYYAKTIKGVTPAQLKNASDTTEFANLLKERGYYGVSASQYQSGLYSKLMQINVIESVKATVDYAENNLGSILLGLAFVTAGYLAYKIIKK